MTSCHRAVRRALSAIHHHQPHYFFFRRRLSGTGSCVHSSVPPTPTAVNAVPPESCSVLVLTRRQPPWPPLQRTARIETASPTTPSALQHPLFLFCCATQTFARSTSKVYKMWANFAHFPPERLRLPLHLRTTPLPAKGQERASGLQRDASASLAVGCPYHLVPVRRRVPTRGALYVDFHSMRGTFSFAWTPAHYPQARIID